jgi:hypothetical protein
MDESGEKRTAQWQDWFWKHGSILLLEVNNNNNEQSAYSQPQR